MLAPNNRASVPSAQAVAISIPNIQEALGIVKKNTYKQTEGYEKDLVVYHNVSERNLETAMELGALPMPSLAITRKDIDFGNFGEITLIGNKDMVDPRKSRSNEVYSRDAYTVRKPVVNYEQPSEEVEEAFHKKDETFDMDLAQLIKDIGDVKAGNKHGFPENQSFIKHIHSFLEAADKVTTEYFEAKPARKVELSEFSGAVIPKIVKADTVNFLKSKGIEIITYDPYIAGDRQSKTMELGSTLNVYFQNNGKYQGAYDPSQNMIELFDGANQSTVIHEGAHMFLSFLEKMENLTEEDIENYFEGDRDKAAKTSERVRKDLSTIREWAAFSEEHLEEYKGTVLEKEFNKHAEDIRNGVEGAEERWIQERFARGFEKYLAEGYAPTKELRGVFRRFKSWLKDVYKSAKNLGSTRLSPEIKDSFDHMISVAIESKGSL